MRSEDEEEVWTQTFNFMYSCYQFEIVRISIFVMFSYVEKSIILVFWTAQEQPDSTFLTWKGISLNTFPQSHRWEANLALGFPVEAAALWGRCSFVDRRPPPPKDVTQINKLNEQNP